MARCTSPTRASASPAPAPGPRSRRFPSPVRDRPSSSRVPKTPVSLDDDIAEVEEAHARFYRAFEGLDLQEMETVWARGEHVRCIHPAWGLLVGWEAVRASW